MSRWKVGNMVALTMFLTLIVGVTKGEDQAEPIPNQRLISQSAIQETPAQAEATPIVLDPERIADPALRDAMCTVIRQHPETDHWSGKSGGSVFAVVVQKIPVGKWKSQFRSAIVSLAHMKAMAELMTSSSLLAVWKKDRLDDATILKEAILAVSHRLESSGTVRLLLKNCVVSGDYIIAYTVADEKRIVSALSGDAPRAIVKESYRETMGQRVRSLMDRGQWNDAIAFWRHLRERELVSPSLYLDAASCFEEIGQPDESARLAREAFTAFAQIEDSTFFERIGELLLPFDDDSSQRIAEAAFIRAAETLNANIK